MVQKSLLSPLLTVHTIWLQTWWGRRRAVWSTTARAEPPLHKLLHKVSTNPKIVQTLLNISGTWQLWGEVSWWGRGGDKKLLPFLVKSTNAQMQMADWENNIKPAAPVGQEPSASPPRPVSPLSCGGETRESSSWRRLGL